jgi:hypothetical protein
MAAATMCGFAVHEARDLSATGRWLVAGIFCGAFVVCAANALRLIGSVESRDRVGRIGNAAFVPLIACTVAAQPILPDSVQPMLLAAGGGAFASLAVLAGGGFVRDIADKTHTRG